MAGACRESRLRDRLSVVLAGTPADVDCVAALNAEVLRLLAAPREGCCVFGARAGRQAAQPRRSRLSCASPPSWRAATVNEQPVRPLRKVRLAGQGRLPLPFVLDHDDRLVHGDLAFAKQASTERGIHRRSMYPWRGDRKRLGGFPTPWKRPWSHGAQRLSAGRGRACRANEVLRRLRRARGAPSRSDGYVPPGCRRWSTSAAGRATLTAPAFRRSSGDASLLVLVRMKSEISCPAGDRW
jgi:hypothetical protein